MKDLVPIGRFSKLCRLSVVALRHYDELGLLRPALVDPDSGYRYYGLAQAPEAERIRLLRSLEMPLEEIRTLLPERDSAVVQRRLGEHRRRIEERIAGYQRVLAFLQRLGNQEVGVMQYEVKVKEVPETPIVSIRGHTALSEMSRFLGDAYGKLFGQIGQQGARPAGPPLAIYHDPEFKEDDIDVEVCVPLSEPVAATAPLVASRLPRGPVAYTLHAGPYDEIGPAYRALDAWMREHGHESAGPPREIYLVGPGQAKDPADYRTEVDWPIR